MKTPSIPLARVLGAATIAVACLLALPQTSAAKDKDKGHSSKHHKHHSDDHDRQVYSSHPRSSFTLSLGTGYAGRGYYYGPPNSPYYYEGPGIGYYSTRQAVPREYFGYETYRSNSGDVVVQRALARRGYYRGPVDGDIGPMSRRAIAHYQQDRGLRVTGTISSSLLRSLGLE